MSYFGKTTYGEAIAQGAYSNIAKWSKIGFTPTMTTAQSDIWSKAGAYVFCTTAGKWEVLSDDAGDFDNGTALHTATCDAGGTKTTLIDDSEDFSDVEVDDCVILDKSGTTPEWGYVTTVATHTLTLSGGFSSGGSCETARAYIVLDKDDADDYGAQAVKIEYLTNTYAEKSEIVILDGNTAVDTVNEDLYRVNSFRVIAVGRAAGTNGAAIGNLTLRADGAGTVYSYITKAFTRARNIMYTVPDGKTLWVSQVNVGYAWVDAAKAQNQYCRIWTRANREPSTGLLTKDLFYPYSGVLCAPGEVTVKLEEPTKLPGKTDIRVSGIATAVGVANVALRGYLTTP